MANLINPQIFDFEVDGHEHSIEFTREALKMADDMGIFSNDGMGLVERTALVLYVGMLKNEPFMTPKRAKDILSKYLEGDNTSLDDFADIVDEFTRSWKSVFTSSDKSKKIVSRQSQKVVSGSEKK